MTKSSSEFNAQFLRKSKLHAQKKIQKKRIDNDD